MAVLLLQAALIDESNFTVLARRRQRDYRPVESILLDRDDCNNGPNGDMFMNYIDYVDDAAMFMFTPQQVARMRTTLDGPRSGLW
jgi:hypothetical protein